MNILAFDTASSSGAVAIMADGKIIAHTQLNIGLTHSEQLLPTVDSLMNITGSTMGDIDALAITSGPGSFTGLRIGFSTAKGMAIGLKKPLVPVPTLDVLAENGRGIEGLVVPIMNARRNQVYTAVYESNGRIISRKSDYQAIDIDSLIQEIKKIGNHSSVYFTGDGVDIFKEVIEAKLKDEAIFATGCRKYVCADMLAFLAEQNIKEWTDLSGMRTEPIYLRESEAVIKWREQHPGENIED